MSLAPELLNVLLCPHSKESLSFVGEHLTSAHGQSFPIVDGIPCFSYSSKKHEFEFEVSVLILTLNEEEGIRPLLAEVLSELKGTGLSYEIVVVDGGSRDRTVEVAKSLGARVVTQENPGYAEAFNLGISSVKGRYLITLDGDLSHPASLIPKLLAERSSGDIVIGSRWIKGGSFKGPFYRRILSIILNRFFRYILNIPVHDLSSGYRLYRTEVLSANGYTSRDFSILEEVLVKALSDGYSFREVPLNFQNRKGGTSHIRLIKFALSYLSTLWRMWLLRNDANSCDYDSRAYDSLIVPQRYWQRKRFTNIHALLGRYTQAGAVLDVGCGSSRIIQSLPHCIAYDLSLKKLRYLKATNPLRVQGSALELPFKNASFDCVIHSQLIEHLPYDKQIFSELARIIKPGGSLIIGTVDYESLTWPIIERIYGILLPHAYADEHITHYSLKSLSEIVESQGFRVKEVKTILKGEITLRAERINS